ncbi:hypothetical protein BDZ89DRAFT_1142889 [Hymenopellis radicata]|nr:hypothetical protein BDZ89DRAFT_1142889 [Hymenopellis radicata]
MDIKAPVQSGDDAPVSSPASFAANVSPAPPHGVGQPESSNGVNPPVYTAPRPDNFPAGCVYDALIPFDQYVATDHPLRTGIVFPTVPSGPLRPALIPQTGRSKTKFYCVTRGLKVGIITDPTEATAYTTGVSDSLSVKYGSHSAALEYFNAELAKGGVKICRRRGSRLQWVCTCVIG